MTILIFCIVLFDQITKNLAVKKLNPLDSIEIIKDFFYLTYVENSGAAFGILQNQKSFFIIITLLVVILIGFYTYRNYNSISLVEKISFSFILGGTIGNFIDRVYQGYVVDFLNFHIFSYDFPVFNIADIFIVLGTGLLVVIVFLEEGY